MKSLRGCGPETQLEKGWLPHASHPTVAAVGTSRLAEQDDTRQGSLLCEIADGSSPLTDLHSFFWHWKSWSVFTSVPT